MVYARKIYADRVNTIYFLDSFSHIYMKSRACGGSPSYKSRGSCKHNLMLDSKNRLLPLPNHVGPILHLSDCWSDRIKIFSFVDYFFCRRGGGRRTRDGGAVTSQRVLVLSVMQNAPMTLIMWCYSCYLLIDELMTRLPYMITSRTYHASAFCGETACTRRGVKWLLYWLYWFPLLIICRVIYTFSSFGHTCRTSACNTCDKPRGLADWSGAQTYR